MNLLKKALTIFENACNDIERIKKSAKHPIEELYCVKSKF